MSSNPVEVNPLKDHQKSFLKDNNSIRYTIR